MKKDSTGNFNFHLSADVVGSEEFWRQHQQAGQVDKEISYRMLGDLLARMRLAGFPSRYQQANLNQFSEARQTAVCNALSGGHGLFIHGKAGRGKTLLAAAVVRAIMDVAARARLDAGWKQAAINGWGPVVTREQVDRFVGVAFSEAVLRGPQIAFKNTAELMDDIKASFAEAAEHSKQEIVEAYAGADVLVLDDLGMEKPTAFVRETFDVIINRRWADEKLTVVTSNLSLARLEAHYEDDGRIASRLAGMCDVIELVGDDRRVQKAQ